MIMTALAGRNDFSLVSLLLALPIILILLAVYLYTRHRR
jgi:hypothetical protein